MAAISRISFSIFTKIDRVLLLWVMNIGVKYECDMSIGGTVMGNIKFWQVVNVVVDVELVVEYNK